MKLLTMLGRWLNWGASSDDKVIELFQNHIGLCLDASQKLVKLFDLPGAGGEFATLVQVIIDLEREADGVEDQAVKILESTFITTVFEREDMLGLIAAQDQVMNGIKRVAHAMKAFHLIPSPQDRPEGPQFAVIILQMVVCLADNIRDIRSMKTQSLNGSVKIIKALERQADEKLTECQETLSIKSYVGGQAQNLEAYRCDNNWLRVFEELEDVTDLCKAVMEKLASMARKRVSP